MTPRWMWWALALPLLCIALAVARAELFVRRAQELCLPIRGYDPRDLLQGHYIQFRLDVSSAHDSDSCVDGACCLCLNRVPGQIPAAVSQHACAAPRSECTAVLPLSAAQRSYRFYVPEAQAPAIERALREAAALGQAYAVLAIEPGGEARVRELLLDGQRYGSGLAQP